MTSEARKVVTIVFTDVTESTQLGEELDPESLRAVMTRYFDTMRLVLERHGGVVEKFIGDAVMAVFGVPVVHEDDALRAVRAAAEMRVELQLLNDELERTWGVTLGTRTGIGTGEVIAGDPARGQSFVVGEAVTTAARLEQTAQPGEILIAEPTHRLVREAVSAEEVGPLELKGKQAPVLAFRLLEVAAAAEERGRRLDSPLVGRTHDLELLLEAQARTTDAGGAQVLTVMGPAGVGKSRLTTEFLSGLGADARTIQGRCLPYGDGITFWPVASVIRDAAGIGDRDPPQEALAKFGALLPGEGEAKLVADRLGSLLGAGPGAPGIQETFWAVRKLFEQLGAERSLVVVFDDVQWGQPTFLDLVEYLADWIKTAPVLLLCLARPELLELRPAWMEGKPNASLLRLDPLTGSEIDGLIANLVGGASLPAEARFRIAEVAEGNPLFVEETLRMFVDDGLLQANEGRWTAVSDLSGIAIPPTIQALLTARLDRLSPEERAVIERAAVVGRLFWWGAVSELSSPELQSNVIVQLHALARKELIQPDYSDPEREASFRFAHILMRDAAYNGIPKAERAELHERLADWIEAEARELAGEYEEILGYHVEQSTRLLLELGPPSERTAALGRRAARILSGAGGRAFARGDMPAAVNLLSRAVSLLSAQGRERAELLPRLAFALAETGDYSTLQGVVNETKATAAASGDAALEAYAAILDLWVSVAWEPVDWAPSAEREASKAIAAFEAVGDDRGLGKAWGLLGLVNVERAQFAAAGEAWEQAAAHARRAGDRRDELESLAWVPLSIWAGPSPAEEGLHRCRELLELAEGDKKLTASVLAAQAALEAGLGRFDTARRLIAEAKALLREVSLTVWLAGPVAQLAGWTELLAGDNAAAERELRWGYETLTELGELSWLSTVVAILAEAVYLEGRRDEAEQLARESESSGDEDAYSYALSRSVLARVLAQRGELEEAERHAQEAVVIARGTDFLQLRWHVLRVKAEVLRLAGQNAEAERLLAEAGGLAAEKQLAVAAEQTSS